MLYSFLNNFSKQKKSDDLITDISYKAKKFTEENGKENVVNGTIGMFKDEMNNLYKFSFVDNYLKEITNKEILGYSPMISTNKFTNGIVQLFDMQKHIQNISIYPTFGGLGAIHHCIHNFVHDEILCFKPYWGPYDNILQEQGKMLNSIEMLDIKNNFNSNGFKEYLNRRENQNIFLLINDPSSNPIGTSLSNNDLQNLKNIIIDNKEKKNNRFIILFDIAYIHYSNRKISQYIELFKNEVELLFSVSLSKSLGIYGLRVGACIYYSSVKENHELFIEKMKYSSRASSGSINSIGYGLVESIDSKNIVEIKKDQEYIKNLIKKRARHLINILDRYNLKYYRYDSGFYITIKNNIIFNKLIDNGIFFVPLKKGFRIAICSLSIKDIDKFEKVIKKII